MEFSNHSSRSEAELFDMLAEVYWSHTASIAAILAVNFLEPLMRVDVRWIKWYFLEIAVLIQGGELDERHIDFAALSAVETDDHLTDTKSECTVV